MPRPPTLPVLDWRAIFANGQSYTAWLESAESAEHAASMKLAMENQPFDSSLLADLAREVYVVAIAEDWCGDVIRHVPLLEKLAASSPRIHTAYLTRMDDPQLFARFLTNGGEALPKFIFLSEHFVECGNWGPMPAECRDLISRGKALGNIGAARKKVSQIYAADDSRQVVIKELLQLIDIATTTQI